MSPSINAVYFKQTLDHSEQNAFAEKEAEKMFSDPKSLEGKIICFGNIVGARDILKLEKLNSRTWSVAVIYITTDWKVKTVDTLSNQVFVEILHTPQCYAVAFPKDRFELIDRRTYEFNDPRPGISSTPFDGARFFLRERRTKMPIGIIFGTFRLTTNDSSQVDTFSGKVNFIEDSFLRRHGLQDFFNLEQSLKSLSRQYNYTQPHHYCYDAKSADPCLTTTHTPLSSYRTHLENNMKKYDEIVRQEKQQQKSWMETFYEYTYSVLLFASYPLTEPTTVEENSASTPLAGAASADVNTQPSIATSKVETYTYHFFAISAYNSEYRRYLPASYAYGTIAHDIFNISASNSYVADENNKRDGYIDPTHRSWLTLVDYAVPATSS